MGFSGTHIHQVDDNGRIRIPSAFKDELGVQCKIGIGANHCLWVRSAEKFDAAYKKKFGDIDTTDVDKVAALRKYTSKCYNVEYDKQGRLLLPMQLKKFAGIDKNIAIIGVEDWIEIWDLDKWNEYDSLTTFDEVMADFNNLSKRI
ncbi:MAG: hypothetical protein FWD76_03285 [Firmicutes bacterium]|nr:hypothetical protein [Bacillota bacterium]